ncbi:MAG: DUF924 domain-containing protein [Alphaproteobacteria bacterium]|nr:DUF924 domain-containing protein [Alphaproteobacteria bacterium]MBV9903481.1 DUF924 domain-containing protein [Alphaproteobacteria bacterium]
MFSPKRSSPHHPAGWLVDVQRRAPSHCEVCAKLFRNLIFLRTVTIAPLSIIQFWRDEVRPERWFAVDPNLDALIKTRYEALWRDARAGKLTDWAMTPEGTLALLIVLDQFPRNMFRGHADAFATDAQALALAKQAVARRIDERLPAVLRPFVYMPYMHSENLADQDACIALFLDRLGPDTMNLPFARQHRDVIARFGRFPTRNAALGRPNTPEEAAFLNAALKPH